MSTCRDCVHWDQAGSVKLFDTPNGYGMCMRIGNTQDNSMDEMDPATTVATIPANFDSMPLVTRSDFGCTLHTNQQGSN